MFHPKMVGIEALFYQKSLSKLRFWKGFFVFKVTRAAKVIGTQFFYFLNNKKWLTTFEKL
jgi:hypothetical protein